LSREPTASARDERTNDDDDDDVNESKVGGDARGSTVDSNGSNDSIAIRLRLVRIRFFH